MKISAVIVVLNGERTIRKCLESLNWVDEIVVVDSFSDDSTEEICREFGVRFEQREYNTYAEQSNYAVSRAENDWVFVMDADEEISRELMDSLKRLKETEPEFPVYVMPRKVYYLGRWIKHSDWYPDYQTKLFDRRLALWDDSAVHPDLVFDGNAGVLEGDLYHYTYRDIADQADRMNDYSSLAARDLRKSGQKITVLTAVVHGMGRFFKVYFLKRGFLDGYAGMVIAVMSSYYVMMKYLKAMETGRDEGD